MLGFNLPDVLLFLIQLLFTYLLVPADLGCIGFYLSLLSVPQEVRKIFSRWKYKDNQASIKTILELDMQYSWWVVVVWTMTRFMKYVQS